MSLRFAPASLALAAVLMLSTAPLALAAKGDDTVVATIGSTKVLKKEVTDAIKGIPQLANADGAAQAAVFPRVLEQVVTEKLIGNAAKSAGLEKSAEYKKRLAAVQEQLVKQLYVESILDKKVTEAGIKAEYETFKAQNAGKPEIRARQILVNSEDEAKQVVKELDDGAKFEELAKKRSTGPSAQSGGEIPGYFIKDEMVPEISDAAFSLEPGTYTKAPIKSSFGWHVIKVEDKRDRKVPELKDIESALRNKLGQDAIGALAAELRAKGDVKLFDIDGKPVDAPK
jgi:peptidyl-prolyl cis-trans isomerase C